MRKKPLLPSNQLQALQIEKEVYDFLKPLLKPDVTPEDLNLIWHLPLYQAFKLNALTKALDSIGTDALRVKIVLSDSLPIPKCHFGHCKMQMATGACNYHPLNNGPYSSIETSGQTPMVNGGKFTKLIINIVKNTATNGIWYFTLRVNGSYTSLTMGFDWDRLGIFSIESDVEVFPDDLVCMEANTTGLPLAKELEYTWSLELQPS